MEQQKKKYSFARRAAVGTAKAWSYSVGLTSLARTGQRITHDLATLGAHVRRRLNDSPENYRCESFEAAVQRLGLDEARLRKQARTFSTFSLAWLAASVLASLWLGWLVLSGTLQLQGLVVWCGVMFMTSSKSITWRFRFCQCRDQELYSFVPWFTNPGRW